MNRILTPARRTWRLNAVVRPISVLVVDDNARMRAMIGRVVGPVAGPVHECGDGAGAVEAYDRLHPDWVLMDINMPGEDGIVATRRIRAADGAARVIIVTQYDDPSLRAAAVAAGACAFVLKEDLSVLVQLLEKRSEP